MNRKRPDFPMTTPAPGTAGRQSAYSTISEPHTKSVPELMQSPSIFSHKKLPEVTLNKMMMKLPYNVRENVSSVVNLAISTSDNAQRQIDTYNTELMILKSELKKKTLEQENTNKRCEIYASRLKLMEEKLGGLQDNIDSRQKHSVKSKRTVNRLSNTNRMLIDAFEALQAPAVLSQNSSLTSPTSVHPNVEAGESPQKPIANENQNAIPNTTIPFNLHRHGDNIPPPSDKLRESLLKIARENYRSVRATEALESKVFELRNELNASERKARQFEMELAEIRGGLAGQEQNMNSKLNISQQNSLQITDRELMGSRDRMRSSKENLEVIDNRLKTLVQRNSLDPLECLAQFRRILSCFSNIPRSMQLHEVALYLCSKGVCKIFESESISLFLVQPDSSTVLRYEIEPCEVDLITYRGSKSLLEEIINSGNIVRLNSLKDGKYPNFSTEIDGSKLVTVKRILAVPIIDRKKKRVVGAFHFLNKSHHNSIFSEMDELFASMFADHAAILLTACKLYKTVSERADQLNSLLDASTALFGAVADPLSIAAQKPLIVEELLFTLENVAREALKCSKSKAFLLSENCGFGSGQLVTLERPIVGTKVTYTTVKSLKVIPHRSGVAGSVITTKKSHIVENVDMDSLFNPEVDLDPIGATLLTIPIIDLNGNTLACLQLVRGPYSPKFSRSFTSTHSGEFFFEQAAQWLVHQLAAPLCYLVAFIGKPAIRPFATPMVIEPGEWMAPNSLSLLPKQFFQGDKTEVTVVGTDLPLPLPLTVDVDEDRTETTTITQTNIGPTQDRLSPLNYCGRNVYSASPFKKTTYKVCNALSEDMLFASDGEPTITMADLYEQISHLRNEKAQLEAELQSSKEENKILDNKLEQFILREKQLTNEKDNLKSLVEKLTHDINKYQSDNLQKQSEYQEMVHEIREQFKMEREAAEIKLTDANLKRVELEENVQQLRKLVDDKSREEYERECSNEVILLKLSESKSRESDLISSLNNVRMQCMSERSENISLSSEVDRMKVELAEMEVRLQSERMRNDELESSNAALQEEKNQKKKKKKKSSAVSNQIESQFLEQKEQSFRETMKADPMSIITDTVAVADTDISNDNSNYVSELPHPIIETVEEERRSNINVDPMDNQNNDNTSSNHRIENNVNVNADIAPMKSESEVNSKLYPDNNNNNDNKDILEDYKPSQYHVQFDPELADDSLLLPAASQQVRSNSNNNNNSNSNSINNNNSNSNSNSRVPTPSAKEVLAAVSTAGEKPLHNNSTTSSNDNWIEIRDGVNPVYYYNHLTCQSSWEPPPGFQPSTTTSHSIADMNDGDSFPETNELSEGMVSAEEVRHGDWLQASDDAGNTYWVNEVTGASAWDLPTEELEISGGEVGHSTKYEAAGGYIIEL